MNVSKTIKRQQIFKHTIPAVMFSQLMFVQIICPTDDKFLLKHAAIEYF